MYAAKLIVSAVFFVGTVAGLTYSVSGPPPTGPGPVALGQVVPQPAPQQVPPVVGPRVVFDDPLIPTVQMTLQSSGQVTVYAGSVTYAGTSLAVTSKLTIITPGGAYPDGLLKIEVGMPEGGSTASGPGKNIVRPLVTRGVAVTQVRVPYDPTKPDYKQALGQFGHQRYEFTVYEN